MVLKAKYVAFDLFSRSIGRKLGLRAVLFRKEESYMDCNYVKVSRRRAPMQDLGGHRFKDDQAAELLATRRLSQLRRELWRKVVR